MLLSRLLLGLLASRPTKVVLQKSLPRHAATTAKQHAADASAAKQAALGAAAEEAAITTRQSRARI